MSYSDNAVWDARTHGDQQAAEDEKYQSAVRHATAFLTGGDAGLTQEAFAEFIISDDHQVRRPLLVPCAGLIFGMASDAELLLLLLTGDSDQQLGAAVCELRARYLASDHTKAEIQRVAGTLTHEV